MAKQTFTTGQVLTSAQMTSLQANDYNWSVNAQTVSYTLVAADAGKQVTMNSASNTTITVNTALFTAGDTLRITNIGTGTCTITAGTATVSSAGSLALTQYASGILWFQTAAIAVFFPDAKSTGSGLVYITGTSFSAVASVSLPNNTFTATYKNYLINYTVTAASTDSTVINARLRAAGTDATGALYSNAGVTYVIGAATIAAANILSGTSWQFTQFNSLDRNKVQLQLLSPQVAADTNFFWDTYGRVGGSQGGGHGTGEYRAATQFDSVTLYPAAGTITGSYEVYGYALA